MRLVIATVALAACASGTRSASTKRPAAPTCNLGAPRATPSLRTVEGYPARVTHLTHEELAKRRDELERRVPGWDVTINRDGYIQSAVSDLVGAFARPAGPDKLEKVAAFVRALRAELDVAPDVVVETVAGQAEAIHAGPEIWVKQQNAGYISRRSVSGPERLRLRSVNGATTLELTVLHPRTTPAPPLPPEMTDDELRAMWSIDEARELRVTVVYATMPCDPVTTDDCKFDIPEPSVTCHRISALPMQRETIERDGVLRRVVMIVAPTARYAGGMGVPRADGLDTHVPLCIDAITGEDLSPTGQWCRGA